MSISTVFNNPCYNQKAFYILQNVKPFHLRVNLFLFFFNFFEKDLHLPIRIRFRHRDNALSAINGVFLRPLGRFPPDAQLPRCSDVVMPLCPPFHARRNTKRRVAASSKAWGWPWPYPIYAIKPSFRAKRSGVEESILFTKSPHPNIRYKDTRTHSSKSKLYARSKDVRVKTMGRSNKNSEDTGNGPVGISLLEQITPLARQINCLDIDRIADICIKNIPNLVGARFASLYILDETNNILHLQKYSHPFFINKIVSLNQNPPSPMVMAVRSKGLILVADINTHKKPIIRKSQRAFAENYKTNNCVIAPLICQEQVVGVLNLADKIEGGGFSCEDIALIELFSQLVGASIGNVKLFEKIRRQAMTDGLTSLANHKRFYEILEKELWRSRRYGGQISLIMVDIDNLKKINDAYGHRAGDKVIRQISRKLKECIRQIDTAARYGGDEFAIILPNTSLNDATVAAERMVDVVSRSPITWQKEQIDISISVGLGQYDADSSPEDITSRSDQALYTAKQAGKNTVRIFEPAKKF